MTLFDILALGLIGISALVSMVRGVVAEVASLITWVVAFMVAKLFAAPFADMALSSIQPHALAVVVAFLLLFVAAAIITPTPDPINMGTVALPLILLYELGILISAVFGRTVIRDEEKADKETKRQDKALDSGEV